MDDNFEYDIEKDKEINKDNEDDTRNLTDKICEKSL